MTHRYNTLDLARLVAAFFVINIHAPLLASYGGSWSDALEGVSRFAVPFFFMASGFLVEKKLAALATARNRWRYLGRHLLRVGGVCFAWYLIYFGVRWPYELSQFAHLPWSQKVLAFLDAFVLRFFYGGPGVFDGAWFYAGMLTGSLIVFGLLGRARVGARALLTLPLLLVVIIASNYFPPIATRLGIESWTPFLQAANLPETVLTAVPYLALGAWLAAREDAIAGWNRWAVGVGVALAAALAALEEVGDRQAGWIVLYSDQFFAVPVLGILVIALVIVTRDVAIGGTETMRSLSGFLYPAQFMIIRTVLGPLLAATHTELNSTIEYLVVVAVLVGGYFLLRRASELRGFEFVKGLW